MYTTTSTSDNQWLKIGHERFCRSSVSVMQNQYRHKRWIVPAKTVIGRQKIQKDVFRLISQFV